MKVNCLSVLARLLSARYSSPEQRWSTRDLADKEYINKFIIDLYINKTYNIILILINKFTKYATYIIIIKNLKADKFIDIL